MRPMYSCIFLHGVEKKSDGMSISDCFVYDFSCFVRRNCSLCNSTTNPVMITKLLKQVLICLLMQNIFTTFTI